MDTVKVEMTPEEFARYKQAMEEQRRRDEAQRAKEEREAYRSLAATTVDEFFPRLESTSNTLSKMKRLLYDSFSQVVETKREVMGVETQGQRSHSFLSTDGTKRIIIGYYQRDGWDETVEDGIAKVRDYISSLAGDEETRKLVDIILDLLSRDGKGNLKAEKVLQLDKYAESIQDARFSEGVAIIKEAYRPVRTKDFVRAQTKNAMGGWDDLPLGMTEA
ncbi:DUF3164 family protein [Porphyromonas pasteri]|uniref:DUF3164 family protein n=1 Tax=Porphyromonas pasteri TaxID=1583331 RepID=UPI00205A57A7|nr:MAG TPA: Protein of unknown function (DUF3164) [Caudoviricetes sp.]